MIGKDILLYIRHRQYNILLWSIFICCHRNSLLQKARAREKAKRPTKVGELGATQECRIHCTIKNQGMEGGETLRL